VRLLVVVYLEVLAVAKYYNAIMQGEKPQVKGKNDVARLRRMSEQMTNAGKQTPHQMIGGHLVKKSGVEQLAKGIQGGMGAYYGAKADTAQAEQKATRDKAIQEFILGGQPNGEQVDPQMAQLMQIDPQMAMDLKMSGEKARLKSQYGGEDMGGDTGVLLNRLVAEEGNGIETLQDALMALKGGAGASGRLGAEIEQGRQANFETQSGKNQSDLAYKPSIAEATSAANKVGTAQGDAVSLLADMEASLPNLENVVQDLETLSQTATYGLAGRAEDAIQRQLGMSVGKDGIARKEYMSKVSNVILPLLKQTFGAAFTVKEGEELKGTLGDPNASPEEKKAVLRSFIANKRSIIESMQLRTGQTPQQSGDLSLDDFLNEGL